MSIKRECIKAGFVVTLRQYGEFVGHELFLRRSELLEELDNYREAKFTSLEIVGIRHLGSYLSPGAMAVVLDQVTWHPTASRDKLWGQAEAVPGGRAWRYPRAFVSSQIGRAHV